jgi:hypothetical protein
LDAIYGDIFVRTKIGFIFLILAIFGYIACTDKNKSQISNGNEYSDQSTNKGIKELLGKIYSDKNELSYLIDFQTTSSMGIEYDEFKYNVNTFTKEDEMLALFTEKVLNTKANKRTEKIIKYLDIHIEQPSKWCCCWTKNIIAIYHSMSGKDIIDYAWKIEVNKPDIVLTEIDKNKIIIGDSEIEECRVNYIDEE